MAAKTNQFVAMSSRRVWFTQWPTWQHTQSKRLLVAARYGGWLMLQSFYLASYWI